MSDDDKVLGDLDDFDWDSALDAWEKSSFTEDAGASPAETAGEAGASGASASEAADAGDAAGASAADADAPGPVDDPLASMTSDPRLPVAGAAQSSLRNVSSEGTVIAPVPRELRDDPVAPDLSPAPPAATHGSSPPNRAAGPSSLPPSTAPAPLGPPAPRTRSSSPGFASPAPRSSSPSGGLSQLFTRREDGRQGPPRPSAPSERTRVAVPSAPDLATSRDDDATREGDGLVEEALRALPSRTPLPATARGETAHDERHERHADDGETLIADRRSPSMSDAETQTRLPSEPGLARAPADDEAPTFSRPPLADALTVATESSVNSRWLEPDAATEFRDRAAWLEEEARAIEDDGARSRALLAASELFAIVGDVTSALTLANEARSLAPDDPLASMQVRKLAPHDPDLLVELLDVEAARAKAPAARAHAALLAADVLRTNGRGDAAVERWNDACRLDPSDARAPAARAALALAQGDLTSAGGELAENSDLASLDRAVATALRLRGHPRPGETPGWPEEATLSDRAVAVDEALHRVRAALAAGDGVAATHAALAIGAGREGPLFDASLWLAAALGAPHIAGRRASAKALLQLAASSDTLALRQLAGRGIELGDPELLDVALGDPSRGEGDRAHRSPFDAAERAALSALASRDAGDDALSALPPSHAPLADALSVVCAPARPSAELAPRTSGDAANRTLASVGRLLAYGADLATLDAALDGTQSPSALGVLFEVAVRGRRWAAMTDALASLAPPRSRFESDGEGGAEMWQHLAAALVAERAGDGRRAREEYRAALGEGARSDAIARAAAGFRGASRASSDDGADETVLADELLRVAESVEGTASAILRLEAASRLALDDEQSASLFAEVHRSAPSLGIGAILAEQVGRRRGDEAEVLHWINERRSSSSDPLELALDAVREALLVADRDPEVAAGRLEEAHVARPDDVALRELYERLAPELPADTGAWRTRRAAKSAEDTSAHLLVEAALAYERLGQPDAALEAARAAAEAGAGDLAAVVLRRLELESGAIAGQAERLLAVAKRRDGELANRRDALEGLADLADRTGNTDKAIAHHRALLEESPDHPPSLRYLEHALAGEAERVTELASVYAKVATALDGIAPAEASAHALMATRLMTRTAAEAPSPEPEGPAAMIRLAARQSPAAQWSLRALDAHARHTRDDETVLEATLALLERTQRPVERAALLVRAAEASSRLGRRDEARAHLEQASSEDPGDVVTWGLLAELREQAGDTRGAAEACESLARTSSVAGHQLLAWYDAARLWIEELKDEERGMSALEAAAELDVTHADVFSRLSALYAASGLDAELARLLERRLAIAVDPEERVALEVDLARALAEMGEIARARASLESALAERPDHTTALAALGELCAKEGDWDGAEQAFVRLARLLATPEEQRAIYERLGEIYAVHAVNLSRAEVAYREVLKRAPGDLATLTKLVDVHKRQGDVPAAVEAQQQIAAESTDPKERLARLVELAEIHETVGRDPRKAEQTLESARKEFPTSVSALRALAEFYARQRQMPAMQILLDRAAADARRSFAAGRFVTSLFEILHAAYELRGRKDAARVVAATLAGVEGQPCQIIGAEARAIDPRLDEVLAPEIVNPALRTILARIGDSLDMASALDLRALRATPLAPGTPLGTTVGAVATVIGLGALQILVSPELGKVALPLGSNPPVLLVGEGLLRAESERTRTFVVVRALKMLVGRTSCLLRGNADDVASLLGAMFTTFNPGFIPPNVDARRVSDLARRLGPALPRNLDPTVGVIALEAAGMIGPAIAQVAAGASAWANRVALLAVGDPNAALDAIAWARGEDAAPKDPDKRAAWIARTTEARELLTFSVTDAYAEARARLGLAG